MHCLVNLATRANLCPPEHGHSRYKILQSTGNGHTTRTEQKAIQTGKQPTTTRPSVGWAHSHDGTSMGSAYSSCCLLLPRTVTGLALPPGDPVYVECLGHLNFRPGPDYSLEQKYYSYAWPPFLFSLQKSATYNSSSFCTYVTNRPLVDLTRALAPPPESLSRARLPWNRTNSFLYPLPPPRLISAFLRAEERRGWRHVSPIRMHVVFGSGKGLSPFRVSPF